MRKRPLKKGARRAFGPALSDEDEFHVVQYMVHGAPSIFTTSLVSVSVAMGPSTDFLSSASLSVSSSLVDMSSCVRSNIHHDENLRHRCADTFQEWTFWGVCGGGRG